MTEEISARPSRLTALPAVIRVGGREYAPKTIAQCLTCQSEYRQEIESHVVAGRPWALIADQLVPNAGLTARNIREHVSKGHLPIRAIENVHAVQERYEELGHQIAERKQVRHDEVLLARLMVQEGVRGLLDGTARPELSEALAAGKFLREMQSGASQLDIDLASRAFTEVLSVVEDEADDEAYQRVLARLRNNPVLEALSQEWRERRIERGQV